MPSRRLQRLDAHLMVSSIAVAEAFLYSRRDAVLLDTHGETMLSQQSQFGFSGAHYKRYVLSPAQL